MPVIHLLRHGQASFGSDDYDVLSALGERQAQIAGHEFARRGIGAPVLRCGSLRRQRDTALIAAAAAGIDSPLVEDPRWNEFDHEDLVTAHLGRPGVSREVSSREFQALLDEALRAWQAGSLPGWTDFEAGVRGALEDLAGSLGPGGQAIVTTSSGVIAAVASGLIDPGSCAPFIPLNRITVNAAITTVISGSRGNTLVSYNDHAHLLGQGADLVTYR